MSANTSIEWADDSVSFWHGCTKVADGCKNCYADSLSNRWGLDVWGPTKPRLWIKSAEAELRKLNRKAEKAGEPRLVFINSMSDFFEDHSGMVVDREGRQVFVEPGEKVSADFPRHGNAVRLDDLRREAFRLFDELTWLRFLLLTKRPENVRRMWPAKELAASGKYPAGYRHTPFRENVWLGTSISDQPTADTWIPRLLECRDLCPVLFLSYEPALGPVDLRRACWHADHNAHVSSIYQEEVALRCEDERPLRDLSWVIIGGESGPKSRPYDIAWPRSVIAQCKATGVPVFHKQLGSKPVVSGPDRERFPARDDQSSGLRNIRQKDWHGADPAEWPEDLRVREFPAVEAHAQ